MFTNSFGRQTSVLAAGPTPCVKDPVMKPVAAPTPPVGVTWLMKSVNVTEAAGTVTLPAPAGSNWPSCTVVGARYPPALTGAPVKVSCSPAPAHDTTTAGPGWL